MSTQWRGRSRPSVTGSAVGAVIGAFVLLAGWMVAGTVPRSETEFRLSDGAAWLTSTAFGGISLHDGGDGAAMTNLKVADRSASFEVEQAGSNALVVNDSTGEISLVEAATWSVVRRVSFADPGAGLDVISGQHGTWLVRAGTVGLLDPVSLQLRADLPVTESLASAAVAEDGSLVYSGEQASDPVRRFGAGAEPVVIDGLTGPVSFGVLSDAVVGLDRDDGAVWADGLGIVCDRLEVPDGAGLVGAGTGSTFLAVADTGSVFAWNPLQGCPEADEFVRIDPGTFGTPVVADGWAVIPDLAAGEVVVVDLTAMSVVRRSSVLEAGTSFDLIGEDDSIWFNDPASSAAGLVRPNGDVVDIQKYSDEGDGGFSVAPSADSNSGLEVAGAGGGDADEVEPDDQSGLDESEAEDDPDESDLDEPDLDDGSEDSGANTVTPPGETDGNREVPPVGPVLTTPNGGSEEEEEEEEVVDEDDVVVQIRQSAVTAEIGDVVSFEADVVSGDPVTFEWSISPDPGSGGSSDGLSFTRTFESEGLFTVQLTACSEPGAPCGTATRQVQVVDSVSSIPLQVSIAGSDTATVGVDAQFTAVIEGEPDSITWSFQDGSPATATDATTTTTFDSVGSKTITVTVARGEERRTDTATILVVAEIEPLDFVLRCAPTTLSEGDSTQCSIDNYSAEAFGEVVWSESSPDGSLALLSGTGGRATLRYDGVGDVTVTASATDQIASSPVTDSSTVTFEAVDEEAPFPEISAVTATEVGATVSFSVEISGGPAESISWTAQGTSAEGSGSSFAASWDAAGDYVVTVTATGPGGTNTDTHAVSVAPGEDTLCNESAALAAPSTVVTDTGVGSFRIVVTANKCATADIVWRGGGFSASSESKLEHVFEVSGLNDSESYTFSSTVRSGGETKFGSGFAGAATCEPSCDGPIVILSAGANITSPTSVELFANTNVCTIAQWSGDAVNKTSSPGNCWQGHTHQNPAWSGSTPVQPGQTYSVTFTAIDPEGVRENVSTTFSFTMPEAEEPDTDADGVVDAAPDNCVDVANADQSDIDGDGIGDACDADADGDGDVDAGDSCPGVANTGVDADGDGVDAACDPDDGAGGPTTGPTCADVLDSGVDTDGDELDDACDADADGDGDVDAGDSCPGVANTGVDADGDGVDAACDPDDGATPPTDPPPTGPPPDPPEDE